MRLICPACSATYEVPEQKLAGRRTVKCARCGEGWEPEGLAALVPAAAAPVDPPAVEEDAAVDGAVAAPAPAAEDTGAELAAGPGTALGVEEAPVETLAPARLVVAPAARSLLAPEWRAPPSPALPLAWGVSVAAVVCGLAFLVIDHAAVAAAWPPMQRLYALLRLS